MDIATNVSFQLDILYRVSQLLALCLVTSGNLDLDFLSHSLNRTLFTRKKECLFQGGCDSS